jgi:hypothetical protein
MRPSISRGVFFATSLHLQLSESPASASLSGTFSFSGDTLFAVEDCFLYFAMSLFLYLFYLTEEKK